MEKMIDSEKLLESLACIEPTEQWIHWDDIVDVVKDLPTVEPQIIHCKDCKNFDLDHWGNIHGMPLIVAHEICTKWGDGCKTKQDGYCFMAERRDDEEVQNNP